MHDPNSRADVLCELYSEYRLLQPFELIPMNPEMR